MWFRQKHSGEIISVCNSSSGLSMPFLGPTLFPASHTTLLCSPVFAGGAFRRQGPGCSARGTHEGQHRGHGPHRLPFPEALGEACCLQKALSAPAPRLPPTSMHKERRRGPGPLPCKTLRDRFGMELALAATQLPRGQPQRTAAETHSCTGSCRSRSWMPRAPRMESTRGWYSKMILRKPCRNGMATAARPDTHTPPPPDLPVQTPRR